MTTVTFEEIQDTDNAITAVVLTCRLLKNARFGYEFDLKSLQEIAQHSCDEKSQTYLWHIWALLNASVDLQHYISGLEIMFKKTIAHPYVMSQIRMASPAKAVKPAQMSIISPTAMIAKMDSIESSDNINGVVTGDKDFGNAANIVESSHQITITGTDEMDTLLQSPNTLEMERFEERSKLAQELFTNAENIRLVAENIYHSPSNKMRFGSPTHRTRLKVDDTISNAKSSNFECSSPFSRRLRRLKRERQKVRRNSMGNILEITDVCASDPALQVPPAEYVEEQDDESSTAWGAKPFDVQEFEKLTWNDV